MTQVKFINQVAAFHQMFGHPIQNVPTIPDVGRSNLRVTLLEEEVGELKNAVHDKNLVEIADALCDIQYVLCGAILEFGLQDKFNALFDEVQRSNMSKACHSKEEAMRTVDHYRKKGVECYIKQNEDQWLVYRREDNKAIKSIDYSPANLASIMQSDAKDAI